MRVLPVSSSTPLGKFRSIVSGFPGIWSGSVLDVGCRSGHLGETLSEITDYYCGLDFSQPANVLANAEYTLPFKSNSFDCVAALDVLEHLENAHQCLDELCRVARRRVIIALPNVYEIQMRLKFALGLPLTGKYGLPDGPQKDRHRWFFRLSEARQFCMAGARRSSFVVKEEACLIGKRRLPLGGAIASRFPSLLAPTYVVLLSRN